jgi:hypothetical protein
MAEIFRSAFLNRSFARRSASAGFISQPKEVLTASSSPRRTSCVTHCPEVPNIAPACAGESQFAISLTPPDLSAMPLTPFPSPGRIYLLLPTRKLVSACSLVSSLKVASMRNLVCETSFSCILVRVGGLRPDDPDRVRRG